MFHDGSRYGNRVLILTQTHDEMAFLRGFVSSCASVFNVAGGGSESIRRGGFTDEQCLEAAV